VQTFNRDNFPSWSFEKQLSFDAGCPPLAGAKGVEEKNRTCIARWIDDNSVK
jgi:hypothetical protein